MKRLISKIKKSLLVLVSLTISLFVFSACSINIDPSTLIPELFINADAELDYSYSDEIYRLELLAGDTYEIDADLGEYEGEEYYIEYSLELEESILSLEENKITVSENAVEGTVEKVFIKLKNVNDEKTYQTETIEILIVLEKL